MRKILVIIGLILLVWLVAKCGDTINNYYGNGPDMVAEDAFAEGDGFTADGAVRHDSTPPLTDVEEWASGCDPPWPDGTWLLCQSTQGNDGPCQLQWDKSACTASCLNPDGLNYFTAKPHPKTVSTYCEPTDPPVVEEVTEDVEEEWAPGCNPPWPDGTKLHCDEFFVDFCILSWDKPSCTASCWSPDSSSFLFQGTSAEAVSPPWPDGFGCSPAY